MNMSKLKQTQLKDAKEIQRKLHLCHICRTGPFGGTEIYKTFYSTLLSRSTAPPSHNLFWSDHTSHMFIQRRYECDVMDDSEKLTLPLLVINQKDNYD